MGGCTLCGETCRSGKTEVTVQSHKPLQPLAKTLKPRGAQGKTYVVLQGVADLSETWLQYTWVLVRPQHIILFYSLNPK